MLIWIWWIVLLAGRASFGELHHSLAHFSAFGSVHYALLFRHGFSYVFFCLFGVGKFLSLWNFFIRGIFFFIIVQLFYLLGFLKFMFYENGNSFSMRPSGIYLFVFVSSFCNYLSIISSLRVHM
ncbi:hypothetical protein ABFS82_10G126200 [Erythranthe guttata]